MSTAMTVPPPTATGARAQGGIIEGLNPILYNPKDPISLFIIQACLIIIFCRLLHYPLSKLGQPRVIAEVIGGILLGPSVMMRIPGFKDNIFPVESMPVLSNVANLGLLLFLFLVGLEVDTRMFRSNWVVALNVGLAGMILPFGLGYGIAWGLYNQYEPDNISFGVFGLFIGTALSITAFPVLCRILSELQLLSSPVGVTVLAAGIGNDVTGWVLLALSVALVNNTSGLTALYVFLTAVAWILFLVFAVRPCFFWILRRSGGIQNGPSPAIVALTLLMTLVSAWFTAAIGVHAIFGAFLVGLICPHHGGFAIKLTEKIEDLVSVLLLPLYFALSGLSTDLGLLDDGVTWGYVIAIIAIAFFGKIAGGALAARACKLLWRESVAIGVLMSCKGLVELIVLNIGLQAGILTQRTFTMFVVMALVTTVATTPLAKFFYPMSYRKKVEKWKRGEIDWDGNLIETEAQITEERLAKALSKAQTSRVLVQLRLDTLSSSFGLVALLGGAKQEPEATAAAKLEVDNVRTGPEAPARKAEPSPGLLLFNPQPLEVRGVRLVELTDRTSSVMQSAELDEFANQDFVFSAFQTFAQLRGVAVAGHVAAVPTTLYAEKLVEHSKETRSDMMVIPWSTHGNLADDISLTISGESISPSDRFYSRQHIDFIHDVLQRVTCTTAIFISQTLEDPNSSTWPTLGRSRTGLSIQSGREAVSPLIRPSDEAQRIFFPFIGGRDDQAALLFVLQLAHNSNVSVTVVHLRFSSDDTLALPNSSSTSNGPVDAGGAVTKDVVNEPSASDLELLSTVKRSTSSSALESRVNFIDADAQEAKELPELAIKLAKETVRRSPGSVNDLVIVGRRHACLRAHISNDNSLESDFQKTVGVLGASLAHAYIDASLVIIHAAEGS